MDSAQSVPKRAETSSWSQAANFAYGRKMFLLRATSGQSGPNAASRLAWSGGLEVPSSNLGAPIDGNPVAAGFPSRTLAWQNRAAGLQTYRGVPGGSVKS
jgi:hypothetical protein